MNRRPWTSLGILVVAIVAIAGHVCVVPHARAADLHSHAEDADIAAAAAGPHHDHPGSDEGAHAASCSGLRTSHVSVTTPAMADPGVVPELVDHLPSALAVAAVTRFGSPPLFLLHASLLI